eukprot:scaffold12908_cov30-Tisochrysis_lutea.AAC.1
MKIRVNLASTSKRAPSSTSVPTSIPQAPVSCIVMSHRPRSRLLTFIMTDRPVDPRSFAYGPLSTPMRDSTPELDKLTRLNHQPSRAQHAVPTHQTYKRPAPNPHSESGPWSMVMVAHLGRTPDAIDEGRRRRKGGEGRCQRIGRGTYKTPKQQGTPAVEMTPTAQPKSGLPGARIRARARGS